MRKESPLQNERVRALYRGRWFSFVAFPAFLSFLSAFSEVIGLTLIIPILSLYPGASSSLEHRWLEQFVQTSNQLGLPAFEFAIGLFILAVTLKIVLQITTTGILQWVQNEVFQSIASRVFNRFIRGKSVEAQSRDPGLILSAILNEASKAGKFVAAQIRLLARSLQGIVILAGVAFLSPNIILFGSIFLGMIWIIQKGPQRLIERSSKRMIQFRAMTTSFVKNLITSFRLTKVTSSEDWSTSQLTKILEERKREDVRLKILTFLPRSLVEWFTMFGFATLLLVLSTMDGKLLALPTLAAIALAGQRLMDVAQGIVTARARIDELYPSVSSVYEHIVRGPAPERKGGTQAQLGSFEIQMNQVSFSYPKEEKTILNRIDLKIPEGSFVGISGESGSGKSTLVDLLLGLIEPIQGTISIGPNILHQTELKSWRKQIAYVSSHSFFFAGTLEANLKFPDIQTSDKRIWKMLQISKIDEKVKSLADELKTLIDESADCFSTGQKQRLAIARALLLERPILILDEATVGIDLNTELAIFQGLKSLNPKPTVILTSHRPESLEFCDFVIQLKEGQIGEDRETHIPGHPELLS